MRWIAHSPMSVWNPINQVAHELDRWFAAGPTRNGADEGRLPLGIKQSEEGLELTAELPGVAPDRVGISVEGGILELRVAGVEAQRAEDPAGDEQSECRSASEGERVRRLKIPEGIDAEGIQANLKYGVLTLRLPAVASPEPKQIKVQVNAD